MPGYQEQQKPRQKLRKTHQTQVQRPLGDLVDLPPHRNRLHLQGDFDQESSQLVNGEVRISERDITGESGISVSHLSLLCHKSSETLQGTALQPGSVET